MSKHKNFQLDEYSDLIWSIVKKYPIIRKPDLEDAFQAGCVGLCEAINRFDESKGNSFVTYAFPWIHKYIREFSRENAFYVHVPANQLRIAQKVFEKFSKLRSQDMSRHDAIKQTSKTLSIKKEDIYEALKIYQSHQDHNTYLDDPECITSLEGNGDLTDSVSIYRQIEKLRSRVRIFPKREREIMDSLYFRNENCDSISDAGKLMNISKQSAQELHKKAMDKLKKAA